ncbi:MAG: SDR family oxidoreductase [Candidatus Andersenbacteria bacterium]
MNIIVFGAASAIAQATIRIWSVKGYRLFLVDRDADRLQAVTDDAKTRGAKEVFTRALDLTDQEQHASLVREATEKLGVIDIALTAYGTLGNQQAGEKDFTAALKELEVNFISVASLLTHLATYFEERGTGTIAVISSVAGDRGRQSNYIYGAAKGALTTFLSGLRNRLAKKGVQVLTIKPGFVDTPMTKDFKKGLLWVKPEVIAGGIVRAVEKKKDVVYLPWFWRYIMLIIRTIPEPIFKKMSL